MTNSPARTGDDSSGATHVDSVEAFEQLVGADTTVLVDFYADWCGPCQMMDDTVEELAAECEAAVLKVDVDKLPAIAARYQVRSIPTFVVLDDGDPTERLVGMQERSDLETAIKP